MSIATHVRRIAAAAAISVLATAGVHAQSGDEFKPQEWQEGKDVIWLPTDQGLVDRMLDLAEVRRDDFVIDLGSGDGRTVIAAARRGARALGIEYNPDMVGYATRQAKAAGVADRAEFVKADLFESDFSKATVITMFLLPSLNMRLRPILLELRPGTRLVSNSFDMQDWQPDARSTVGGTCTVHCQALLWIVPAKFGGSWKMADGGVRIEQDFQMVRGELTRGDLTLSISNGRIVGDRISFRAGAWEYAGRLNDGVIEGEVEGLRGSQPWRAERAAE